MAFLWSLVVIDPLIILSTILCGCVSIVLTLFDKTGNAGIRIGRLWARSLLVFTGARVRVEGLNKIDTHGKYVFCSNHLSYMDTPVVLGHIPVQFRFLAKRGLFQIPFMGTHLKQAGHIPVPLEDPRAAVRTLSLAAETIQKKSVSLLIFPEGGRSEDGILQEFKDGDVITGNRTKIKVVKNKVAAPFREAEVDILYGQGISRESDLVDLGAEQGLVEKSGSWFSYGGERLGQGRENARAFLKEHTDVRDRIDAALRSKLGLTENASAKPSASETPSVKVQTA
jgi:1-acyl-sn-glycerol-3-phosphate acyltransferase